MPDPIKLDDPGNTGSSPKITIGAPPSSPAPASPAASADKGGSSGNIFTQTQAKKEESKMISSIISQKEVAQKTKSILGPAPTLEKSIEQEKEVSQKRKLRFYQFVFVMIFVSSVAMSFYFYSELSPDFNLLGANTTARLTDTNDSLRNVQTLLNKDRYLAAQLKLNEFSYQADRFLSSVQKVNDPSINEFDKRAIFADLDESEKTLPVLLGEIRDVLTKEITAQTFKTEKEPEQTPEEVLQVAQTDLRNALKEERKKYGQNPTNPQDILDVKLIDNATKLVGNTALMNALQGTSQDAFQQMLNDYAAAPDPQKLKTVQDVIGKVLSSTKSDLATIADIKHNRVEWSSIIGQIKEETLNVDQFFDQPLLYDIKGGIVYTGYEFDSNNNKIVLSGVTKTLDGTNFTLMSNLIDQLENSQYFQDVDMRSFSKSKSGTGASEGFTANFKIDLSLEPAGFSDKNAPVKLQSESLKGAATGTKRETTTSTQESAVAPSPVSAATTQEAASSASAAAPAPAPVSAPPADQISAPASGTTAAPSASAPASAPVKAPGSVPSSSGATTAP